MFISIFFNEEMIYPMYLGRKDELTDEDGVFDVARVDRIFSGKAHIEG